MFLLCQVIQRALGQEGTGHLSVDLIILRKVIVVAVSEPRNVRSTMFSHKFKKTCGIEF